MKIFIGTVISVKMKNTATVRVDLTKMHKLYGKRYTRSKKYHVHDEHGVKVGDVVSFVASKPYSKLKKWKIIKVGGEKRKSQESRKEEMDSGNVNTKKKGKKE